MKSKSINTINYTYRFRPETGREKQRRLVYASPVVRGTVDNHEIADELSRSTTLTATDVEAVLTGLSEKLIEHLRRGELVKLSGIGSFMVSIKSQQGADSKGAFKLTDLYVSGIVYRPSKKFLAKVRDVDFSLTGGRTLLMPTEEEIALKLDEHFSRTDYLTSTHVMQMFGVSRRRSLQIIARLVEQGVLVRRGNGPTTHYVLAPQPS